MISTVNVSDDHDYKSKGVCGALSPPPEKVDDAVALPQLTIIHGINMVNFCIHFLLSDCFNN